MLFEKMYYTEMEEEFKAFEQEEQMRKAALTQEELEAEERQTQSEIEKIIEMAGRRFRILSERRRQCFSSLVEMSTVLAEIMSLDITAVTDGEVGIVRLKGECFLFDNSFPAEQRELAAEVMRGFDSVCITAADGMPVVEMRYALYEAV